MLDGIYNRGTRISMYDTSGSEIHFKITTLNYRTTTIYGLCVSQGAKLKGNSLLSNCLNFEQDRTINFLRLNKEGFFAKQDFLH